MINIKTFETNYGDLLKSVGEDKIKRRYEFLFTEIQDFIKRIQSEAVVSINERLLMHSVLEYYEDITKLKDYHSLIHANSPKVIAYTSYWLLRRKPIILLRSEDVSDKIVFINERFVLSFIMQYSLNNNETKYLSEEEEKVFKAYLETFLYYLKYRKLDAQSIEMIIMGFEAGKCFSL